MRLTYACPACHATVMLDHVEGRSALDCPGCHAVLTIPPGAVEGRGDGTAGSLRVRRCLVCPSGELFARKDFPQRLGLAIVVAGFAASCVTWGMRLLVPTFAILCATALVDVVLYLLMPECLVCYRCGARYQGDGVGDEAEGFDLETHERHRQASARTRALAAERTSTAPAHTRP